MKKGFTLVELLAVIVILAIIALIATPIVINVINDAEKGAAKTSATNYIIALETALMLEKMDGNIIGGTYVVGTDGNITSPVTLTVDVSGDKPVDGKVYVSSTGKVQDYSLKLGKYYVTSNDGINQEITENLSFKYRDSILKGADPELDSAMIPVVINNDGTLSKADINEEWYNYIDKNWANVVLVSDATRENYKKTEAGTPINAADVKAYYVWVPRYKYQIFTDVENLETVASIDSKDYVNKADIINVVFENNETIKSVGTDKDEWLTHPAFTFGTKELNGIWVGKFETTGTASAPTVLGYDSRYTETSNITSLRNQNVSSQFATSSNIVYGLSTVEPSMLKNMEWGAVAYLSASAYGQGKTEIMINNSSDFNTGCAATTMPTTTPSTGYAGCENEWYTTAGQKASTTGTAYGIYDMSGGSWEYVMGVIEDSKGSLVPVSGRNNLFNSGFTGNFTCPTCDTSSGNDSSITRITGTSFPKEKYYDIYAYSTTFAVDYAYRGHLGDATYELDGFAIWGDSDEKRRYHSGWNYDYAYFVYSGAPWFIRSGGWNDGASAGVFAFNGGYGPGDSRYSFRSVLR